MPKPKDDEPAVLAPPFMQALRAMDHLWMAANALSHIPGRAAKRCAEEIDHVRAVMEREVLPRVFREQQCEG